MNRLARTGVWIGSAVSGVTGVVYWWMDNMMPPVTEWAAINHPLQPLVLKAHIVTAPLLVFAVGLIWLDHVWKHFRTGVSRGRRSGHSAMWTFAPMVVTGYLIQAVTDARWLAALSWLHVGSGVVYLAGVALHQVAVRGRPNGARARSAEGGNQESMPSYPGDT